MRKGLGKIGFVKQYTKVMGCLQKMMTISNVTSNEFDSAIEAQIEDPLS